MAIGASQAAADPRPVLFVTNHAPAFRIGAFARLHEQEGAVFALIGGRLHHGGGAGPQAALRFPVLHPAQREIYGLAASGRYRAVVAGLSGRLAPAAAWRGARRARVPFVLWATMWAHPRTAAHLAGYPLVRRLYRDADAVITYGPHVSDYVRGKRPRGPVFEAPQAVDDAFWRGEADPVRHAPFQVLFSGRLEEEKGVGVLLDAWQRTGLAPPAATLVLTGDGPLLPRARASGLAPGRLDPVGLRNFYAGSDVLVLPSLRTRTFREPWGLAVNEAFNRGIPAIVTDAVGAAAGGLVEHGRTGLVVPAGNAEALAGALRRLRDDTGLRGRLAAAAADAVAGFTQDAWVAGVRAALAAVGVSRRTSKEGSTE
jgi:glycosyltransferase involved in cell wall biosynthesis